MHLGYIWRRPSWRNLKILIIVLIILGLFYSLFIWRLGSLTPGLSPAESAARTGSLSLHGIINNPINAPQRLIQLLLHHINPRSISLLRTASVFWAGIFILCFYGLARRWFGKIVGTLGTLLFASTPLFILSARSATQTIMMMMPLAIAACYIWAIKRKNHINLAAFMLAVVVAIGIYSPGTLIFMMVAAYFARKQLLAFAMRISLLIRILCVLIVLSVLTPLIRAIALDWAIIKPLFLVPAIFTSVYSFIKAFAWSSLAIVWRTRNHLDMSIGRWPMLNAVQSVLLIFGVIAMSTQALAVGCMLMIFIILCIFTAAINSVTFIGSEPLVFMALPALSMFIAAGLRYLYIEWKSIFPRNPLPRTLAVSLMVVLVAMQIFFGIRYALVAWPHTADTLSLYVLK